MSNTNNLQPFVPAQVGFKASYNIDFSSDPVQVINLTGSIQGDAAVIRSLHINNINNPSIVTCTFAGDDSTVPAYSDGYVNVDGQAYVTLTCNQPVQISVDVMTARQPAGFVARGLAPGGNTASFTAGEAIQKGDVVTQGADGNAYWGNDPSNNDTLHAINGSAIGPVSMSSKNPIGGWAVVRYKRIGSNVYAFASNGTLVYMYRLDLDGNLLATGANLISGYGAYTGANNKPDFIKLANGDICVCYGTNVSGAGKGFCIFTIDALTLAVKIAPVFFGTFVGTPHVAMCLGSGNNVAVAYYNSQTPALMIFTPALAVAFGPTNLVGAGYVNPTPYNADAIDIDWVSAGSYYAIAFVAYNNTADSCYVATYNSSALLVTSQNFGNVSTSINMAVKALSNGCCIAQYGYNVVLFTSSALGSGGAIWGYWGGKNSVYDYGSFAVMAVYATNGANTLTWGQISTSTFSWLAGTTIVYSNIPASLAMIGGYCKNNDYVVMLANASNIQSYVFGTTFNGLGATYGSGQSYGSNLNFFCSSDNGTRFLFAGSWTMNQWASSRPTVRPMGIALGNAATGQVVTVQVNGTAQTRLNFKQAYSVNAQALTPPGQKMNIVGNAATMAGIQA